MDELLAILIALVFRRRRPEAPAVNQLVERLKASTTPAPPVAPIPAAPPSFEPPEAFAVTDMSFADDVLMKPRRRKRTTTLATFRSAQGLLGAIVASEILAPPIGIRSDSRGA